MLQMLIGNAHYHCFCVRYVASDNLTLALIIFISLSPGLGMLLVIAIIIGVACYRRRSRLAAETVDENEQQLESIGQEIQYYGMYFLNNFKEEDQQYSTTLPSEHHSRC